MNNNHSKLNNYLSLNALLQKQAAYYGGPNSKYAPKLPKGALQIGLTNPALPAVTIPNPPHTQKTVSEQYKGITNPSLSFSPSSANYAPKLPKEALQIGLTNPSLFQPEEKMILPPIPQTSASGYWREAADPADQSLWRRFVNAINKNRSRRSTQNTISGYQRGVANGSKVNQPAGQDLTPIPKSLTLESIYSTPTPKTILEYKPIQVPELSHTRHQ